MLLTMIRLAIGATMVLGTASWAQDALPQPQTSEEILQALSGGADGGLAPAGPPSAAASDGPTVRERYLSAHEAARRAADGFDPDASLRELDAEVDALLGDLQQDLQSKQERFPSEPPAAAAPAAPPQAPLDAPGQTHVPEPRSALPGRSRQNMANPICPEQQQCAFQVRPSVSTDQVLEIPNQTVLETHHQDVKKEERRSWYERGVAAARDAQAAIHARRQHRVQVDFDGHNLILKGKVRRYTDLQPTLRLAERFGYPVISRLAVWGEKPMLPPAPKQSLAKLRIPQPDLFDMVLTPHLVWPHLF